ncbi:methyltransferase family protein [Bacteroidota bacterium]
MNIIEIIVFVLGTICLIYISWNFSLKQKRYHGIPRFFTIEGIFLLVLLNYFDWFINPFSLIQIVSWILLISSAIIVFLGFYSLYKRGKPEGQIENTTNLITTGIYKYIRHPIYSSVIPGVIGILLKDVGYIQIILVVVIFVSLVFTAKVEEREMIKKFESEYENYSKKTKMFIPFIF